MSDETQPDPALRRLRAPPAAGRAPDRLRHPRRRRGRSSASSASREPRRRAGCGPRRPRPRAAPRRPASGAGPAARDARADCCRVSERPPRALEDAGSAQRRRRARPMTATSRVAPDSVEARRVGRPLSGETGIPDALYAFNHSDHRRTVAGLTRTLGLPRATGHRDQERRRRLPAVRLTIAWELTWYQWEVGPSGRGHEVRESGKGETIDQLRTADRAWNLLVGADGTVQEKALRTATGGRGGAGEADGPRRRGLAGQSRPGRDRRRPQRRRRRDRLQRGRGDRPGHQQRRRVPGADLRDRAGQGRSAPPSSTSSATPS